MSTNLTTEIINFRVLNFSTEEVFQAFENPDLLMKWWGPKGFTNTFHVFDLQVDGVWKLTMHGPEKGNYENESIFSEVEKNKRVAWKRITQPLFNMVVEFEEIDSKSSKITFHMSFDSVEECNKIRRFATPSNEENFDRLEELLNSIQLIE
jgi:uncharacterized protein YndB with AHSA1/START domain